MIYRPYRFIRFLARQAYMRNTASMANNVKTGATQRRWSLPLLVMSFWTLMGLLDASQRYLSFNHDSLWWQHLATRQLTVYYFWAALTPLVFRLGRRFTFEQPRRMRGVVAHVLVGSVVSIFRILAYTCFMYTLAVFPSWEITGFTDQFVHFIWVYFSLDFLIYCAILGAGLAFDYHRRYRENELQAAELRTQLAQAQLEALRVQIHPHFLFNTLNSIVGLIRNQENQEAIRMTTGLGDLLRHALDHPGKQEVTLREEMEFLERYLNIQQMRFSDRLRVEMNIDRETLDARVPSLILQPIVENAIRHGIAARDAEGIISLSAGRDNGHLRLSVYNDGPTLPAGWRIEDCGGIGLANTRARIERLYGAEGRLEMRNRGERGVEATLTIPYLPPENERNGQSQEKDQGADRR